MEDEQIVLTYFVYEGPVLPMTVLSDANGITAARNVVLDFSDYNEYSNSRYQINVTDSYVLDNASEEDQTVTLCYPYVGSMDERNLCPFIRVDGEMIRTTLYPGPYAGGFEGPWGGEEQNGDSCNLKLPASYDDFEQLLSGTDYIDAAFSGYPSLEQPAYVYRLHDFVYPQEEIETSARLQMEFTIDPEKTRIFSRGFNRYSFDEETGLCTRAMSYRSRSRGMDDSFLIVLGEDLTDYNMRSYLITKDRKEAACPELSCSVTRYETTWEQVLLHFIEKDLRYELEGSDFARGTVPNIPIRELYLGLTAQLLEQWGRYGETPVDRYANGNLGLILTEVNSNTRVMYLSFDVTIPAGESVTVTAWMPKKASYDMGGSNAETDGYGLATNLGSNLIFTEQTASITNFDGIEIIAQNFGFDPEKGITTVELLQEHHWIEVRRIRSRRE